MAEEPVRLRPHSRPDVFLPAAPRRGPGADPGRPATAQVLRGRHGPEPEPRHHRELPDLPRAGPPGIPPHGGGVQLHRDGRHPVGPSPAGRRAAPDPGPLGSGPLPQEIHPMTPKHTYGMPPAGVDLTKLTGTLIVIEGPDASGRSTQIALLTGGLEEQGHAVAQVGLRRSTLVGPKLERAMQG